MKTENRGAWSDVGPSPRPSPSTSLQAAEGVTAESESIRHGDGAATASGDTLDVRSGGNGSDTTLPSAEASGAGAPAPGQRFGGIDGARFELLDRLGGGGMSDVFLARDTVLDRRVAIKFLTNGALNTEKSLHRIRLEAQACARLNHENIVRLFDMGTDRGMPFLVMEYLEGSPLDTLVRQEGRVDVRRAVRISIAVAKGLSQAHRAGIVHRDLKPSNVFITKDGTVKILDFGVATMTERAPNGGDDSVSGTPRYMSPEQWRGEEQDGRTDIWSLGVMLFELLAGKQPFRGANLEALRNIIVSPDPPPSLQKERPDLPEEADRITQRAMTKRAAERFGTADELLDALVSLELSLTQAMRARRFASAQPKPRPERRQTTVLSCSFHDPSELPGEAGLDEFGESFAFAFEICATTIRQLEGTLVSSLGPRIVACFGYPIAHEDSAQRALRAASLIVDSIPRHTHEGGRPCAVRIGIGTSHSLVSQTEIATAPLMLHGDALHVAQWLEQRAQPGEILVGRVTQMLARGLFDLEPLGEATPEGTTRPLRLYRVLRSREAPSRFDPRAAGSLTPFVGRHRELDILHALWEGARRGGGRFVLLTGEAGIGKSRLLEQKLERIANDRHTVVRCQCWPHFQNSALSPIVEGLTRKLGLRGDIPEAERIGVLTAALAALDPALREHAPLLAAFCGIPTGEGSPQASLSPDFLRRRMLDALVAIFARMAERCPSIVIVEDAHWSDGSTVEFLDLLRAKVASANLLVIVTARPDFQVPWQVQTLMIGRLSPEESTSFVALAAAASHGRELPRPIVDQLVQRTDGVPLFIEELTHWVADAIPDAEQPSGAVALDAFVSSAIPATLEGLLRARLDALPQDGRDVAQLVAVLGRDAAYDLVHRTSELPVESLRVGLTQLLEAGILRQEGPGAAARYTFRHALVREAAYQSLVKSKRVRLHRRAAEVLATHFRDVVERHPELLAAHFAEAECHDQAVLHFETAAQRALQRAANPDAATHFGRAIAQLRMLPETPARDQRELALQIALRGALIYAGELTVPADFARRFAAQSDGSIDPAMMLVAQVALAVSSTLGGNFPAARDHALAARLLYEARGRQNHAQVSEGVDPGSVSGLCLAWSLLQLGDTERAREAARNVVDRAEREGYPANCVQALIHLSAWYNQCEAFDVARRLADDMALLCGEDGFEGPFAMAQFVRGWSRLGKGDRHGIRELEEGVSGRRKAGDESGMSMCLAVLARARLQQGSLDEALRTMDEAMAIVESKGERFFEAELYRLRGEALFAKGADASRAEACFERGLAIARQQQARFWERRLEESYARLRPSRVTAVSLDALDSSGSLDSSDSLDSPGSSGSPSERAR
ncbi:protein kinase domain-containing protein [Pendulispora albinea]|uniref:Protein kinase n=1 Tax=Pendulispora albinea TaxID=2741071 RepID=A0ABZ2M8N2_9BACT